MENRKAKWVVVTGASTGIGRDVALWLAEKSGFSVFVGVRKAEDGEEVLKAATPDARGRMRILILDVTNAQSLADAAAEVDVVVGEAGLWGLVNNAGVVVAAPLEFVPIDRLRYQFEVNVIGQIATSQVFLPLIRRATGRLIFVGSLSGRVAFPFTGPYAGSKFAIRALCDAFRMELSKWQIPVVLIEPGAIRTPIWKKSLSYAEEMEKELSPAAKNLYSKEIEMTKAASQFAEKTAIPTDAVSQAIAHALTAPEPKATYQMGKGVSAQLFLSRFVPPKLRDRIILNRMKSLKWKG
jgi:NAD(P)-dependent dehydrogenase (short-subunit alcohol dehydrogenase family)